MGMKLLLWSCIFIGTSFLPITAFAQDRIRFPWRPGWANQFTDTQAGGEIEGRLFKPVAAHAPFVVFMHGCGGLHLARVSHWGKFFTQRGIGFLMVDSFETRKGKNNYYCGRSPLVWEHRRADDAASAQAWLTSQPYVKSDRIAIMGQSQGGTSALLALHEKAVGAGGFVAGLAMYPGCIQAVSNKVHLAKPVLVMVGSEDTVTLAAHCVALQAAQPDQTKLDLIVYPGATHEFDNPVKPYLFLGFKGGEHAASRAKAQARVAAWIGTFLKQ